MTSSSHTHSAAGIAPASESQVVHSIYSLLRILFIAVPIVAGADKFTNLLAQWETYLNPLALSIVPVSATTFMGLVGVIEIAAGILVLVKPRLGSFVVMAWLLAIALQLLLWGRHLDIAVRDIVIALGAALTLARLAPYAASSRVLASGRAAKTTS